MSWDIFVQDIPVDAATIDDIPDSFVPACLGLRSDIIQRIKEVAPFADFSDPAWGTIDGEGFSIEVNLGDDEDLESFAFHVRGSIVAAALVSEILKHLKLRAFDTSSMPGKKSTSAKRRTQVKSLPKRNKKLTGTDLKKVRGGGVKMGDIVVTHPIDKSTPILH